MEIQSKIETLFESSNIIKQPDVKDTSSFELKQLESQMNKHLQSKQGQKFKKVSIFNFDDKKNYNEDTFGELVNKEIENKYIKKKWASLPMFMKWNLVQDYMVEKNIVDKSTIAYVKDVVHKNKLDIVVYDNVTQKVTDIILPI